MGAQIVGQIRARPILNVLVVLSIDHNPGHVLVLGHQAVRLFAVRQFVLLSQRSLATRFDLAPVQIVRQGTLIGRIKDCISLRVRSNGTLRVGPLSVYRGNSSARTCTPRMSRLARPPLRYC